MEKKPLKLSLKKKPMKLKIKKEEKPEAVKAEASELALPAGGGVKIIFQNAKIHADKVIIKKAE